MRALAKKIKSIIDNDATMAAAIEKAYFQHIPESARQSFPHTFFNIVPLSSKFSVGSNAEFDLYRVQINTFHTDQNTALSLTERIMTLFDQTKPVLESGTVISFLREEPPFTLQQNMTDRDNNPIHKGIAAFIVSIQS